MQVAVFFFAAAAFFLVMAAGEVLQRNPVVEALEGFDRRGAGAGITRRELARLGAAVARVPLVRDLVLAERLERQLRLAGYRYTAQEWLGLTGLCFAACAGLGFFAWTGRFLPLPLAVALPAAGLLVPVLLLKEKAAGNRLEMEREFIVVVEKVALLCGAGIPLVNSLKACAGGTVLGREIARVVEDCEAGTPVERALDGFLGRVDLPDAEDFVWCLKNALRYGPGSLPGALKNYVGALRHSRESRIEAVARKAEVRLLFPLVFTVLPATALMVLGPFAIMLVRVVFDVF